MSNDSPQGAQTSSFSLKKAKLMNKRLLWTSVGLSTVAYMVVMPIINESNANVVLIGSCSAYIGGLFLVWFAMADTLDYYRETLILLLFSTVVLQLVDLWINTKTGYTKGWNGLIVFALFFLREDLTLVAILGACIIYSGITQYDYLGDGVFLAGFVTHAAALAVVLVHLFHAFLSRREPLAFFGLSVLKARKRRMRSRKPDRQEVPDSSAVTENEVIPVPVNVAPEPEPQQQPHDRRSDLLRAFLTQSYYRDR